LQLQCTITHKLGQVFKIITGRDAEPANKVPCRGLQVTVSIVNWRKVIFGPAEIAVAGNGLGTVELAQTLLGLRLRSRIESFPSEEFVG